MRYLSVLLTAGLFAAGCCGRQCDKTTTRYHEDGRAKPVVSIPAVIDTTSFDAPWSISEELTSAIVQSISQSGQIYIQALEEFSAAENPFGQDLSWMKRELHGQEFAVFLELVEHELVPVLKTKNAPLQEAANHLHMGVRVRVVDLRGNTPKIVLQEMVRDSYYIPKSLFPTDYNVEGWGSEAYPNSPMGIAHAQIVKEIAVRISDYILLAKSR